MSIMRETIDGYFKAESPLRKVLAGFSLRPEQLEMARLVADAMSERTHLAVEAGAGTGKTLAYLVPALLSGQRIVIATATKTLQDQLYHRDLPAVCQALGRPVDVALLKGRSNYLCIHRLKQSHEKSLRLPAAARKHLRLLESWSLRTDAGDIAEVSGIGEEAMIWPLVTSTVDNCLGSRCPEVAKCHVARARKRAADADVAIVNHHLLLADMSLKDDGLGRLLPGAEITIVDEAHRFPDTAQAIFDTTLRSRQVEDLARDVGSEAREAGVLEERLRRPLAALADIMPGLVPAGVAEGESLSMSAASAGLTDAVRALADGLDALQDELAGNAEVSPGLARCAERAGAMALAAGRIGDWQVNSDLCWVQNERGHAVFHMTPLDASSQLAELLCRQGCTWILTSATLAVAGDFAHFSGRLGLTPLQTRQIASPFDYERCARLYLPPGLPPPESGEFTAAVVEAVAPVLQASRGRAFLLFTSRKAMLRAAQLLEAAGGGHTLLVQGAASRSSLLQRFTVTENALLLGTATFWEGVDVRGPSLVVVVIDRLPFASPGDPLLQARLERIRRAGGEPFRDYQLPQAVLALRQGVGRLIRGYDDYGVVILCDPRLTRRGYGKVFLESLPPMPIVYSADEACGFLSEWEQHQQ